MVKDSHIVVRLRGAVVFPCAFLGSMPLATVFVPGTPRLGSYTKSRRVGQYPTVLAKTQNQPIQTNNGSVYTELIPLSNTVPVMLTCPWWYVYIRDVTVHKHPTTAQASGPKNSKAVRHVGRATNTSAKTEGGSAGRKRAPAACAGESSAWSSHVTITEVSVPISRVQQRNICNDVVNWYGNMK